MKALEMEAADTGRSDGSGAVSAVGVEWCRR